MGSECRAPVEVATVISTWNLGLAIAAGVPLTLALTGLAFVGGGLLGGVFAWLRLQVPLNAPVRLLTDAITATPPLVHILWIYYALPQIVDWQPGAFTVVVLALGASTAALMSEILRAAYEAIPAGQSRAARVLGLSPLQRLRFVLAPQMLRNALPPAMNLFATLLKETSLAAVIAVPEVLNQGQIAAVQSFRPITVYSLVALIYFILIYPVAWMATKVERSLAH